MEKVLGDYAARQKLLEASTNPFARGIAWVEGQYTPLHEARIPLLDQGFMHGDLTYDVPAVWDGRYFRLDDHLDRLEGSVAKMRMRFPLPKQEIRRILIEMVAKSGIRDAFVEIIVTRGLKGVLGSRPNEIKNNNLYMFVKPYMWVMEPDVQPHGGSAVVARTVRRISPGSFDPTIKNLQWGDFTRGMFEAQDRGATYPFLTDGDGNLTEGSGFNIVLVKDGVLYTPDRGVLQGITRKSVIDAATINGLETCVQYVPVDDVYHADEIFMCTTAGGIMPITTLDGQPVNGGKLGPITQKIWDTYWEMHWEDKFSFTIKYEDK
ncbi:D-aminoacid aminotransferase-like PLP-dependent enzyme [Periconia macrospinosa]|uniref:D-aminoacid aminotransferase-like PLP-dependent enzyme n=1 Tax=Periconia macrospinosa TaxID=97972 RepID=A0A2V1D9S7_9PLEO|nr:D-aminoacid aminotransferase-like PLP-dependent enzyme [Periconia macrospinosa]